MDCDGRRQLLITDVDGSFTGKAGNTIISKAEYEWDGNPSFGLGMVLKIKTYFDVFNSKLSPYCHCLYLRRFKSIIIK